MGKHKIILPLDYQEPEPTPLEDQDIQHLTRWAAMVHDPYMLIYCLRWGLGADPELLLEYAGDVEVRRKFKSFPNRCRRQLNRGERTVIGFDDMHKVFAGLLNSYFEIALLTPWGASSLSGDSRGLSGRPGRTEGTAQAAGDCGSGQASISIRLAPHSGGRSYPRSGSGGGDSGTAGGI